MRYQSMRLFWWRDNSPPSERKSSKEQGGDRVEKKASQQQDSPKPAQISKVPTGLGSEPVNIVILGASFAGLSCAHHFLDHTIDRLRITKAAPNYRLVIVSPSTHLYWNIGAPRALVAPDLITHNDLFLPIEPGFHRHRGHNFSIIQGEAIALDPSARTVTVECIGSTAQKRMSQINKRASQIITPGSMQNVNLKTQTIRYHAIIMATGTSTHSDLLSLHGPHLNTMGALTSFHARVAAANSIVICGGGCSGVETAGQLATFLNYRSHWPIRKLVKRPKQIILISGGPRCLQDHKPQIGMKAENLLKRLGVEVKHDIRVVAAKEGFDLTGQTKIELNDDTSLIADLYIPCTGVIPNADYVPAEMKDAKGFILANPSSLRVDHPLAGARTYAIGDVASHSQNWVLDVYTAIPTIMQNLLNDLLALEYQLASPYGGNRDKIDALVDRSWVQPKMDSQLCPISRFGGVGVIAGLGMPSLVVHQQKGYDYKVNKGKKVVVDGGSPYPVHGKLYE